MLKNNYFKCLSAKSSQKIRRLMACGIFGLMATSASASLLTFDFEDLPSASVQKENTVISGFNFSPSCHYDINDSTHVGSTGNWIGFDMSGCNSGPDNQAYLGPSGVAYGAKLFVNSASGQLFDLLSFNFALPNNTTNGVLTVHSSNGGYTFIDGLGGIFAKYAFAGPEWTDLTWLVFSTGDAGAPFGFDNLALNVRELPEPGSLILVFLGVAAVACSRRRI